ncbi:hypothetical protein NPS01_00540 [Nocardioides psychrotolerans]|uniref:Uncharacterized protein n=1 Tax=Nocardioides psychrotolerans TaxID=1005945 RepID=A0A1I3BXZ1_9ACTN|nr:hypothetical protein [Nocardioides psychrotolerans]GEP36391.1 hypothetical protein NPS01_00540 [Nocardioides psychrotolerans]SFH67073.1 hypothetical protein SAMN05216561_101389 [Nocardioides psychrotolerans]
MSRPRQAVGRATKVARPLWETTLRDPVRDGHLRLDGLTGLQRQLAKVGLVATALLLVSVLFADVWRGGDLLSLYFELTPTFVPRGLMPVTLVTMTIAWSLLLWGALSAGPLVKVFVGAMFGLTGALFLAPSSINTNDSWILEHGPMVVKACYYTVLGCVVLSTLLHPLTRARRWATYVLQLVSLVAVCGFFLGDLAVHVAYVEQGFDSTTQSLVGGAIDEIDSFLVPLVYAAAVAVVKFGLDVSTSITSGLDELSVRALRWVVLALVLVKLWFVLVSRWDYWLTYASGRGPSVVRTLVSLVLLALVVWLVTRFTVTPDFGAARERLIYGSSVGFALTFLVVVTASCAGIFAVTVVRTDDVPEFVGWLTGDWLVEWGPITVASLALVAGIWLLRRRRRTTMGSEVGSGLVVVAAWSLPSLLIASAGTTAGFQDQLFDVAITLLLLGALLVWWRRWEGPGLVSLAAITLFAWLVMSRGDYIAFLGSVLGLPAIVVTVFGIAYVVASDAGFTATSSRRLPQGSRVLLFVGYLLFSVTILHWDAASHGQTPDAQLNAAFFYLGIPIAAWLLGRQLVPRADDLVEDEPESMAPDDSPQAALTLR